MNFPRRTVFVRALTAAVLGSALPSLVTAQVSARSIAPVSAISAAPVSARSITGSAIASRITEKIDDSKRTPLAGHVRPFLGLATDEGEVSSSAVTNPMMLIFSRTAEQQAGLDATADALHNRNSPMFHKWLTPTQFGASYSPADSDIAQVGAWLQSKGLKVLDVPPSKTFISFTGTVGQLKSAFGVSIHKFTINGEKHAATINDPQIPSALASVVGGIRGLDNFGGKPLLQKLGPMHVDLKTGKATLLGGSQQPSAAAALAAGKSKLRGLGQPEFTDQEGLYQVGPQDFYTIYNESPLLSAGITGAGQTIALIEEALITTADVDSFRSVFGLPAYPYPATPAGGGINLLAGSTTGLNGYASCYSPATLAAGASSGEEGEADLDAQWAGTVAPNATIDFVACGGTATSPDGTTLGAQGIDHSAQYIVNYLQGTVVAASMSYGECESAMTTSNTSGVGYYNLQWQQFAVEGITPIVSSGDSGAAGCYQNKSYATSRPPSTNGFGSSAWNISAGGTDFSDEYQTENFTTAPASTWWNATNGAGLGSAISYIPETTWGGYCSNALFISSLQADSSTSFGSVYDPIAICSSSYSTANGYTAVVGGSGGASTVTTIPSWQSVYGVGKNSVSTTYRNSPDLSFFAANGFWGHILPYCESDKTACTVANYEVDEIGAGGTSFVAPQLAGLMALIAQKTGVAQGQANYTLYNLAAQQYGSASTPSSTIANCSGSALAPGQTPPASCIFHDISSDTPSLQGGGLASNIAEPCRRTSSTYCDGTIGSTNYTYGINVVPGTTAANGTVAYLTGPGYDDATGLGSANITNLVNNWNSVSPALPSTTVVTSSSYSVAPTDTGIVLTAKVTATGRGSNVVPAGTAAFYINGVSSGSGTIAPTCTGTGTSTACSGVATVTVNGSKILAGSNAVTAVFSGDAANDAASTSAPTSVVGTYSTRGLSIVSPTLKPNTTAYITAYFNYTGAAAPTGAVTMLVNGSSANVSGLSCITKQVGTASGHTNCTATYSSTGVAPGNYTLTVAQAADSTYAPITGTGFVTVTKADGTPAVAPAAPVSAVAVSAIAPTTIKAASIR